MKLTIDGKEWWREGVQFQCQGSGQCCTSHGEFGFVYLTRNDRKRLAQHFKMRTPDFTKKFCEKDGDVWRLKEEVSNPDCIFLENKRCTVYQARPEQCRTWPFWPEVMKAKTWTKEIASFCPGVGKGPLISGETIEKSLRDQLKQKF